MIRKNIRRLSLFVLLLPSLAACGLGYGKNPPDEFNVVRRAPLILPPEFSLRPPSGGQATPAVKQGAELARLVVLRAPQSEKQPDEVEQRLLEKAARGGIYGDGVRDAIESDRSGKASEDGAVIERLVADQSKAAAE
ncbi:MAG TPA: hypothetical protein DCS39_03810 [Rhodobiaceae bacterium]|nr:hypothetical protein [Rhodobiaceae bacterium]